MEALTRTLKLKQNGRDIEVPVRIFWPLRRGSSWFCRWEIEWPTRTRSNEAGGIDAVQALRQALEMVGTELYCSEEHEAGRLTFDDSWKGYGFPVPQNLRDRLIGDDKKYL